MQETADIDAVQALAVRVLGENIAGRFRFALLETANGRDAFEFEHRDDFVMVRGTSVPAMTAGLYRYLTCHASAHVSWYGSHLGRLGSELPSCGTVRAEFWARWRYFLNYCCYSYSLPFWGWEQWESLVDWMALRGVNMPLAMTGQEAVWRRVFNRLELSEADQRDFFPGPAYLPFGWMGCLDGWTGPLPKGWIDEHEVLGRKILQCQRQLGMKPVLQGFTGHVPAALAKRLPKAAMHKIRWFDWETYLLDPMEPLFGEIARIFLEEQARCFGTNHLYAADTFIEMTPPSGEPEYLEALGKAIYDGMARSDPQAVWVLQGWAFMAKRKFWSQNRIEAFLRGVPHDRILLLDLHCEREPMWETTEAFGGKPWIWCNVQTFGRNVVMTGAFEANNTTLQTVRHHPLAKDLVGIGMVNESLCYNSAAYDFFFEQAWREQPVDPAQWATDYAAHRYGKRLPHTSDAWKILATSVYREFRFDASGLTQCPTLVCSPPAQEETAGLVEAWRLLLSASQELKTSEAFHFDLINVSRQVLSNLGSVLKQDLFAAIDAGDRENCARLASQIRELLGDLSDLLATHPEFCLAPWVESAEHWGADADERAHLRKGALRQITLWGESGAIRDYARKEWSGLIRHFYLPRWERWFEAIDHALENGSRPDKETFVRDLLAWERRWLDITPPDDRSDADPIAISQKLYAQYVGVVRGTR